MRSESVEADFDRVLFYYVPDYPFGHAVAPLFAGATYTSKHATAGETGCRTPNIERRA